MRREARCAWDGGMRVWREASAQGNGVLRDAWAKWAQLGPGVHVRGIRLEQDGDAPKPG